MQGNKKYEEKLFMSFQLSGRVPEDNFYRRLRKVLDLRFLYPMTKQYYGRSGQQSIDPVVFFKICLVGYLENIISDRALIQHCSMRLDILFFLGYDIDEELPWHSTISRTRQLYPETVFEEVFNHILTMCIDKGMVAGHTQAIDSALIKANASMDSLELKVPEEELDDYLKKVRAMSSGDKGKNKYQPKSSRKAKNDKSDDDQRTIQSSDRELKEINTRQKKWSREQTRRPGASDKRSKYTSNKTHYSPTDPDARISVKPGKARKLNFQSQISVDTANHVITDIGAYHADKKDNQYLQDITKRLKKRLNDNGLIWQNLLADTGYSSGENYAFLEKEYIRSFIPPHGTYKGGPGGFTYIKEDNYWLCPAGKHVTFRRQKIEEGTLKNIYFTTRKDCQDCPIKTQCIGKQYERRINITAYREEYERNIKRVESPLGRYMKGKRQSTVEPVFGILTQFMGMRKINTIGIHQANKVMHLAAIAYNLKKYLKFTQKQAQSAAMAATLHNFLKTLLRDLYSLFLSPLNFTNFKPV